MIYHLLPEEEPFSDVGGGAISRWVANVVRETDCIVACPSYDATWQFPTGQILEMPGWKRYGKLRSVLPRGRHCLELLSQSSVLSPLRVLLKALSSGDVLWVHNRTNLAAHLSEITRSRGVRVVLHRHNLFYAATGRRGITALRDMPVVFCSEFLAQDAETSYPGLLRRRYVLHNGADLRRFHSSCARTNSVPQIVFTGRLIPEKGVHVLLEAMRILQGRGIVASCKVIGGAQFGGNKMTSYVRSLHSTKAANTEMVGYLAGEAVADCLREADIHCCPSIWEEPFGMVIVEAMASGLPIVASHVGGIPEVLQYGGGTLVPPNDPKSLASALEKLIVNRSARDRLAVGALRSFHGHFSWRVIRDRYSQILDEVRA